MLRILDLLFRGVSRRVAYPIVLLLMPLKIYAYKTRFRWLKRLILEVTSLIDWLMVLACVQNPTMLIHFRVYRGNFLFGKSVMQVAHHTAAEEIAQPTLRGNRFMGIDIVSNDPASFVTNAGPITTAQPVRGLHRQYIDNEVMNARVRSFDLASLCTHCEEVLSEWVADRKMASAWSIRGAVTRLFLRILSDKMLPKSVTDDVTFQYTRRFAEFSLFGRHLPILIGLLGTREAIRSDAYIRLRRYGIDNVVIDMTLFAAMFSIGTIVLKCIEFTRLYHIDYMSLSDHHKMSFVIESQRLYPTVTTVHRIIEEDESISVFRRSLRLVPGDEVTYPFACINRDPHVFTTPDEFRLDRGREEMQQVLSWSAGPHMCPAKDLSILVTILMLDTLASRFDLRTLKIFSPEF